MVLNSSLAANPSLLSFLLLVALDDHIEIFLYGLIGLEALSARRGLRQGGHGEGAVGPQDDGDHAEAVDGGAARRVLEHLIAITNEKVAA